MQEATVKYHRITINGKIYVNYRRTFQAKTAAAVKSKITKFSKQYQAVKKG